MVFNDHLSPEAIRRDNPGKVKKQKVCGRRIGVDAKGIKSNSQMSSSPIVEQPGSFSEGVVC
jgi:hypothetical protein